MNRTLARPSVTPTAQFVGEGQPIPFARMALTGSMMPDAKIATMVGVQNVVAERLNDRELDEYIRRLVLRALVLGEDTQVLSDSAADADAPAGLLFGVDEAGGGSPGTLQEDIHNAISALGDGEPIDPAVIYSPRAGAYLASYNVNGATVFPNAGPLGGSVFGINALVSPAAANRLIFFDQARIARWQGDLEISASTAASVEFLDNPTNSAATATHTNLVSAFQCDTTVLRFVKYVSWHPIDVDHASYVTLDIGASPS